MLKMLATNPVLTTDNYMHLERIGHSRPYDRLTVFRGGFICPNNILIGLLTFKRHIRPILGYKYGGIIPNFLFYISSSV